MRALSILCLIAAILTIILGLLVKVIYSGDYSQLPMGIMPKTYINFTNMLLLFSIAFFLIGTREDQDKE